MELRTKIEQAKARKKGFLKAMPEEQRRLLKMHDRAAKRSRRALLLMIVWLILLLLAYFAVGLLFPYPRCWMWNGIMAGALLLLGVVLLFLVHRSQKNKAAAVFTAIADYVTEYGEIDRQIVSLKKAERNNSIDERKARRAQQKAKDAAAHAERAKERAIALQTSDKPDE